MAVAAADPIGDPALVWRAGNWLGVPAEAAGPAAQEGLLEIGAHVSFPPPLARSAACLSVSLQEREAAHRSLAESTDPEADPDRRAWHLAQATSGPNEEVAAKLEDCAGRAQSQGVWPLRRRSWNVLPD
jgi:hypothetical protein